MCSPRGHCRRFAHALPLSSLRASTFLPSFPRRGFASRASRGFSPRRYYEGSDSCPRHRARRSPRLSRHTFPTFRLQPRGAPRHRFTRPFQRAGRVSDFAMNEQARRHTPPNRVRLLRTASSLPVALHPASRRRGYLRLRGLGLPRHGLPPCRCGAFTGALIPAHAGTQCITDFNHYVRRWRAFRRAFRCAAFPRRYQCARR